MPNKFVFGYDDSKGFRDLVQAKIRAGTLTREAAATIAALPTLDGSAPEARRGRALCAEYFGEAR